MGLREGKGWIWEGKAEPGVPFPSLPGSQLKLEEFKLVMGRGCWQALNMKLPLICTPGCLAAPSPYPKCVCPIKGAWEPKTQGWSFGKQLWRRASRGGRGVVWSCHGGARFPWGWGQPGPPPPKAFSPLQVSQATGMCGGGLQPISCQQLEEELWDLSRLGEGGFGQLGRAKPPGEVPVWPLLFPSLSQPRMSQPVPSPKKKTTAGATYIPSAAGQRLFPYGFLGFWHRGWPSAPMLGGTAMGHRHLLYSHGHGAAAPRCGVHGERVRLPAPCWAPRCCPALCALQPAWELGCGAKLGEQPTH